MESGESTEAVQPRIKLETVRLIDERKVSVRQAAQDLDGHENALSKWVRKQPQEAFAGNGKMTAQDAETVRLRREVVKVKMERNLLENAAAYFAKKSI
jgi:transposase